MREKQFGFQHLVTEMVKAIAETSTLSSKVRIYLLSNFQ